MTDPAAEDVRLVELLCGGDANAARELYRRHGAALLRFGLAMGAPRPVAEDMVHDTFVEFLHDPGRFEASRGSVAGYLYGIARHQWSRVSRRGWRESEECSLARDALRTDAAQLSEEAPDSEDALDRARLVDRVRAAVAALPVVHREVVALCDLEELPYATVAQILDCPIGTVRSRLHRARAALAQSLDTARTPVAERRQEVAANAPPALACPETPT